LEILTAYYKFPKINKSIQFSHIRHIAAPQIADIQLLNVATRIGGFSRSFAHFDTTNKKATLRRPSLSNKFAAAYCSRSGKKNTFARISAAIPQHG
jgi:hypothetical protein